MTNETFIKKVEELGLDAFIRPGLGEIRVEAKASGYTILTVNIERPYAIDTDWDALENLTESEMLLDLAVELSKTPISKRNGPKYNWVIANSNYKGESNCRYFNYQEDNGTFQINDPEETEFFKTEFTEERFRELEKELGIEEMFRRGDLVE